MFPWQLKPLVSSIDAIIREVSHVLTRLILFVFVTLYLTWKIYARVCLKFGLLAFCIHQNLYHMHTNIKEGDLLHIFNFVIYIVFPILAATHILIFDVKECILIVLYTVILYATPGYFMRSIFGQYYYHSCVYNIDECRLCRNTFEEINKDDSNCQIALYVCRHTFCEQCLNQWEYGKKAPKCPLCRKNYYELGIVHKVDLDVDLQKGYFSIYVDWRKY
eukprot:457729_1